MQITLIPTPINELTVYLVLEDLGERGRVWREIVDGEGSEPAIVEDIITGQYEHPLRVVAFNTDEGWSRDVTDEVAAKLLDAALVQGRALSASAREFVERVTGRSLTVVV
jgi:hypothetical protein